MDFAKKPSLVALLLTIFFVLLQTWDISTYPVVGSDEAFLNDPGLQLERRGQLRSDVFKSLPGYDGVYFWQPPGLSLAATASYHVFGFGIWQTRIVGIAFGGIAIALVFLWVRSISDHNSAGVLAALGLFFLPDYVLTAKIARMDTAAIAFMLGATILVFDEVGSSTKHRPWIQLSAGLCAGIAGMFHTAAFPWFLGLLVLLMLRGLRRLTSAAWFVIGAALPVSIWLYMALKHQDEFRAQFLYVLANRTVHGGVLARLTGEGVRYLRECKRVPFFLVVAAVGAMSIIRGKLWNRPPIRWLLTLWGVVALFNALFAGKESGYYTLYPKTLLLCAIAAGMVLYLKADGKTLKGNDGIPYALVGLYALFLLNGAAFAYGPRVLAWLCQSRQRDYQRAFADFSMMVRPGDQVWGTAAAWYALVEAGARIDAQPESVPAGWRPDAGPDPAIHRFIITERARTKKGLAGYRKITEMRAELPLVFGTRLADHCYCYEIWQSESLK